MLSILIPTYNYNCTALVKGLQQQAAQLGIAYEIIVADDCSTESASIEANQAINQLPGCLFYQEEQNRGRAAIRNRLADRATMPYLLFMDCDAELDSSQFLANYIQQINENTEVVCGGLKNVATLPSPNVSLRFAYEADADKKRAAHQRSQTPYQNFTTFCFLIERTLFFSIRFNEKCTQYGYEDALFGVELMKRDAQILHIDNPLIHAGLDTNEQFLHKTKLALQTLHSLGEEMQAHTAIAQFAAKIKRKKLAGVVRLVFKTTQPLLMKNLHSKAPSLLLFSFYKLGYYLGL